MTLITAIVLTIALWIVLAVCVAVAFGQTARMGERS